VIRRASVANPTICILGEAPVWDAQRGRVLWADIERRLVFSGILDPAGTVTVVDEVGFPQGVSAIAVSESGDWLVAGTDALWRRGGDGTVERGIGLLPAGSGRRLNDGKPDPSGAFVVGSLAAGASESEMLVRVGDDGTISPIDSDLTLSNGMAWSSDGRRFYNADSDRRVVFVRSYDPATGSVGDREVFVSVERGYPDGICADVEDHLWIALWGAGEIHRYSPRGELVEVVDVAAPHVSSVAFAGALLDTLIITTATEDLSEEQRQRFPDSGRLFSLRCDVPGIPHNLWNGNLPHQPSLEGETR